MPKRDDSPAISLFSFQDIVTSITGIMFLVVLMLLLLMLERKAGEPPPEPDAVATTDAETLRKRVQTLHSELTRRIAADRDLDSRLAELRDLGLDEAEARREQVRQEISARKSAAIEARRLADQRSDELAAALRNQELQQKLLDETQEQLNRNIRELAGAQREVAALEQEVVERRRLIRYTIAQEFGKQPILAECGADGIRIQEVKTGNRRDFADGQQTPERFLEWAKLQNPGEIYFLLLVKPAAFGYARQLRTELGDAGFQRGVEILPDDEATIFAPEVL